MRFHLSRSSIKLIAACAVIFIFLMAAIAFILFSPVKKETKESEIPAFYAEEADAPKITKPISLSDYYITKKTNYVNSYYIDDNSVLWGSGSNDSGQLGTGEISDVPPDGSVKIAENVVSVDCSDGYDFCIYLTADGNLYGMGENLWGILTPKDSPYDTTENYGNITSPVLLMDGVAYARAGQSAVVLLKKDGSVWWWGQFAGTYRSSESNYGHPLGLFSSTPQKVLEGCVYATVGNNTAAAITADGALYTWGLNVFGQCGCPVTSDDYVRQPQKVLENVHMVWPEKIEYSSTFDSFASSGNTLSNYPYNTFAQLESGDMLAAGLGLGEKEKTTAISGDLPAQSTYIYSDTFVPIRLKKDSYADMQAVIEQLKPGTTLEEVKQYLSANGIQYDYSFDYDNGEYTLDKTRLILQNGNYTLCFDENNELTK